MRVFGFIVVCLLFVWPEIGFAKPQTRYAAIAVVEETGEVLHARHADALRHPASLTKVMTLYLLFDAIKGGEIGFDDQLRVSAKAAKAKPSKLGLTSGQMISVEDAIRALVTKSANDVAIVVAERLSGGEAKFAGEMTRTARLLGMSRTRYANASGLPDKRQVTSARDMAVLAAAIHQDFPEYYRYFSLEKFVYGQSSYGNHSSLLGRIAGVDGLKTGYTNASGYNIAVTAERDQQRLIVVVFGGSTAIQRDSHAADLVNAGFKALKKREKPAEPLLALRAIDDPAGGPVIAPAGLSGQIEQGSAARRGVRIIIEGQDQLPTPTADTPSTKPISRWLIQVGAYTDRAQAEARLRSIDALSLPDLQNAEAIVESANRDGKTLFRARFRGLLQKSATRACVAMTRRGEACFPLAAVR